MFIIAPPRSGTTLVQKLMSLDSKRFVHLKMYQTIFPSVCYQRLIDLTMLIDRKLGGPFHKLLGWCQMKWFGGWDEMHKLRLAEPADRLDATVLRMPKAYPGYYGTYNEFDALRAYLDAFANLYLIGRNGMHRYNNQDHSMLSAKEAVAAIVAGRADKAAIWAVNIDDEYHEEKTS